jgi:hypothetical protein
VGVRRKVSESEHDDTPAESVLDNCDFRSVNCSNALHEEGIEIALFLQFHDSDHQPLPDSRATARVAYRNFKPEAIEFTRLVGAEGGIVDEHDRKEILRMHSGREEPPYYWEGMIGSSVGIEPGREATSVSAEMTFKSPKEVAGKRETLDVEFPQRGEDFKCSCCLLSFRMPLLSSSTG